MSANFVQCKKLSVKIGLPLFLVFFGLGLARAEDAARFTFVETKSMADCQRIHRSILNRDLSLTSQDKNSTDSDKKNIASDKTMFAAKCEALPDNSGPKSIQLTIAEYSEASQVLAKRVYDYLKVNVLAENSTGHERVTLEQAAMRFQSQPSLMLDILTPQGQLLFSEKKSEYPAKIKFRRFTLVNPITGLEYGATYGFQLDIEMNL